MNHFETLLPIFRRYIGSEEACLLGMGLPDDLTTQDNCKIAVDNICESILITGKLEGLSLGKEIALNAINSPSWNL